MFDNTGIGNSGFRELDTSELALIAGGHFGEELTDEYINFQIALQSLSILQKAALLDGMADAGMLPSPMSGGEGSEIIVTGDSGSNDPNLFTGSLLEGAFEILLDLMRDANEQDREILLGLLESGEIDTFLNTVDDGAAQPIDTASIDIEVNIDRPLTEGEQEAIEKLEAFIAAVTTALNMLPDNAQITLENGQVVTAGELKQAWASTDFRIDDTNTQYANQSYNSEAVYNNGNPQININIGYLEGISNLEGGVEWFVLHELAHFSEASLQDRSTTVADSIANAPSHERMANEIAAALAQTFGINIYTGAQYGFDGDPATFSVPDGSGNSNGSNDAGASDGSDGSSAPGGDDTPELPGGTGDSGGGSDPDLNLY